MMRSLEEEKGLERMVVSEEWAAWVAWAPKQTYRLIAENARINIFKKMSALSAYLHTVNKSINILLTTVFHHSM